MSSNASAPALHLEPRPSARLRALLILLHVAVAAGLLLALPLWLAVPALALPTVLLWREWRASRPPVRVVRDAEGAWWLEDGGPFALQDSTLVTPWLVVLALRGPPGTRRLALLPDSLEPTQWRRLRALLRVRGTGTRGT